MYSREGSWVINPADLFPKPNDSNQDGALFSQDNDLDLGGLSYLLGDGGKGVQDMTNDITNNDDDMKELNNNKLNLELTKQDDEIDPSILTNSIDWDDLLTGGFKPQLDSGNLFNSVDQTNEYNELNDQLNDIAVDVELYRRQSQLAEELQRQQEVNMKLEQQLQQTKIQQEMLKEKLKQQEEITSTRLVLGDITQASRLNGTPKKKTKEFNISKSTNSSPSKKVHSKLSFMTPMYSSNIHVSPQRKHYRSRSNIPNTELSNIKTQDHKEAKLKINFATTLTPRNQDNFITDSALSSPLRAGTGNYPADSPIHNNYGDSSPVLGQGMDLESTINMNSKRNSISISSIPALPVNKSPVRYKQNSIIDNLPSSFQDTPLKLKTNITPTNLLKTLEEEFKMNELSQESNIQTNVPRLNPPQVKLDFTDGTLPANRNQSKEPATIFNVSKTPSPTLKSQSYLDGHSPKFESISNTGVNFTSASPLKITRKLTTLPRGSIDRYVKELPDKTFECLYPGCTKTFKRRYNVRSHIQTHLEDRPYACDFPDCKKAFVRNHDLIRHKKSHQEKKLSCPCGKKFNREDALIVHRSRMICSGGKRYENVVIKKSPRKRGRPRRDSTLVNNTLPIDNNTDLEANKENHYGTNLVFKMNEQTNFGTIRNMNNI